MAQFNSLAHAGEQDGVVSNNIAASNRMHSDLTTRPLSHHAAAPIFDKFRIRLSYRFGHNLTQRFGSTAGRVFFQTMVSLYDLHIKVVFEGSGSQFS